MRELTEERKAELLKKISELGDDHWDMVREQVAQENEEFAAARKALTPSRESLAEEFTI